MLKKLRKLMSMIVLMYITSNKLSAQTIHWITFIDTENSSIGFIDKNARTVLYSNFINVVNNELKPYGYNTKIYDCYGESFTQEKCKSILNTLKCDVPDVVVFYYIGHGQGTDNNFQNTKYPLCVFGNRQKKSISLSWLHQQLKNKGARLVVTIGSCSNIITSKEFSSDSLNSISTISFEGGNKERQNTLKEAFLGNKGDIIVCAASPGQDSYGGPTELGVMDYFTYEFVTTFERMFAKRRFNWIYFLKDISEKISTITKKTLENKKQTPIYDCNLMISDMPKVKGK